MDYTSECQACTSVRRKYTEYYELRTSVNETIQSGNWGSTPGDPCWDGQAPSPPSVTNTAGATGVLRSVETDTYLRSLYNRSSAVQLHFSPSLNWKRLVDGGVLANNQIRSIADQIKKGH